MNGKPYRLPGSLKNRWFMLFIFMAVFAGGLWLVMPSQPSVPKWFEYDPARPYEIFDAWRHLSTRESALIFGSDWLTIGGVLCDERGRALPHTPLRFDHSGRHGTLISDFVTDAQGRFLIYGSPSLWLARPPRKPRVWDPLVNRLPGSWRWAFGEKPWPDQTPGNMIWVPDSITLSACPGYPDSRDGRDFAASRKELH